MATERLVGMQHGAAAAIHPTTALCLPITIVCRTASARSRSGATTWLFAGSLRAGKRAAAIKSLIQSARLNGHDAVAYMKDMIGAFAIAASQPRW